MDVAQKLRYQGRQYAAGQSARGGGITKHWLEDAADEIERLRAEVDKLTYAEQLSHEAIDAGVQEVESLRAENKRLQNFLAHAHTLVQDYAAAWWRVHCGNVGKEGGKAFQFSRAAHENFCAVERTLKAALAAKGE